MPKPVFVPQVEPRESVEEQLENRKEEDLNLPHWNWCAICCVRMIVLGLGFEVPDMIDMYNTATEKYGVYRLVDGRIIGAYHRELASYVKGEFGLKARALRRQSTDNVARWISRGYYFIASVSSDIRKTGAEVPIRQNGHLVLVYDVLETSEGRFFILHNSAGFSRTNTQSEVLVSENRFAQCFSGNGLIISGDHS
ncbi:MAG: C39 family peptidase [Patescibacteria group bacterium]|jgi:hypothetical protein